MAELFRRDLSAAHVAGAAGSLTLDRMLALLVWIIAEEAMTEEEFSCLMQSAQAINEEMLVQPPHRGVDVGPWDVSETGWRDLDLLDSAG